MNLLMRFFATMLLATPLLVAETATYDITVDKSDPTRLRVAARIPNIDGRISMAGWGADQMPRGWASFVQQLRVTSDDGTSLHAAEIENATWQVNSTAAYLRLTYDVDASFARSKWPYGNEQAGFFDGRALFIVSKALFIVSGAVTTSTVTFTLPTSWRIAAPWNEISTRRFGVSSSDELINNSLVIGEYAQSIIQERNFRFILALLGPASGARELVTETLRGSVRSYMRIFPDTPPTTYVMTLFHADAIDAEAYRNSAAFTERDPLRRDNRVRWGQTVAHELFHAWNGHAIQPQDYAEAQWLTEGFTDYFATRALRDANLITPDRYLGKMEKVIGLYLYFRNAPAFADTSLRDAGKRKGFNRLGIYAGGWTTAFCLEQTLRERTGGARGVADFMAELYKRFGTTGRQYTFRDVVLTANDVAGADLTEFFSRYVAGNETLPLDQCLAKAGLRGYSQEYDGEMYIVPRQ